MSPGGRHFWHAFFAHCEMMRFLIVFYFTGGKNRMSFRWIVSELALSSGLKVGVVYAKVIVSANLIQGILIPKEFVLCEIYWIFFMLKTFELLSAKVLTPASWVVPMRTLQGVFRCFINNLWSHIAILFKLLSIAGEMASIKSASFKVCCPHPVFFLIQVESIWWLISVLGVLSLRDWYFGWRVYWCKKGESLEN